MNLNSPDRYYHRTQIALHWVIAALVLLQRYTSGAINRSQNPFLRHTAWDVAEHTMHNYGGMLIGALMVFRLFLRLRYRQDLPARSWSWRIEWPAFLLHGALYTVVLAQTASGLVAAYLWRSAGRIHSALWTILLILVAFHIAAAVYHAFRKDGVFGRMVPFLRL